MSCVLEQQGTSLGARHIPSAHFKPAFLHHLGHDDDNQCKNEGVEDCDEDALNFQKAAVGGGSIAKEEGGEERH